MLNVRWNISFPSMPLVDFRGIRAAETWAFARKGTTTMVAFVKHVGIRLTRLLNLRLRLNKPLAQQRDHVPKGRLRGEAPRHLGLRHVERRFAEGSSVAINDGGDTIKVNTESLRDFHNRRVNRDVAIVFGQLSSPYLWGGEGEGVLSSSGYSVYL